MLLLSRAAHPTLSARSPGRRGVLSSSCRVSLPATKSAAPKHCPKVTQTPAPMSAPIESKAKEQSPPDAVSCILVDHANSRVMFGILDDVIKRKDDAMLEKVVHTLGIHCRLHNQTRSEVVLPLVQKLQGGDKLAKLMEEKVMENEQLLAALDATKKHLDNDEFVQAARRQKQADMELMDMAERDVLPAMLGELDSQELVAAAKQMERVKVTAPLTPQVKA